mmetsp:Transcript_29984/g.64807  ORF Transcript_29984/g.64807 Transcript_29984/m.64807 type:complete len:238 (-) Transcript_29984:117-830(-)
MALDPSMQLPPPTGAWLATRSLLRRHFSQFRRESLTTGWDADSDWFSRWDSRGPCWWCHWCTRGHLWSDRLKVWHLRLWAVRRGGQIWHEARIYMGDPTGATAGRWSLCWEVNGVKIGSPTTSGGRKSRRVRVLPLRGCDLFQPPELPPPCCSLEYQFGGTIRRHEVFSLVVRDVSPVPMVNMQDEAICTLRLPSSCNLTILSGKGIVRAELHHLFDRGINADPVASLYIRAGLQVA